MATTRVGRYSDVGRGGRATQVARWFLWHIAIYSGLLALMWLSLAAFDPDSGVESVIHYMFAYLLAVMFVLPVTGALFILWLIGHRVSGAWFRVVAVPLMVLAGGFVVYMPSFWIWVGQLVIQVAMGFLVRAPVRQGRRSAANR